MRRFVSSLLVVFTVVALSATLLAAENAAATLLTEEQFNNSAFYGRTAPGQAKAALLALLNDELRTHELGKVLTEAQIAKLRAAGEKDIDRWLESVAAARAIYTARPLDAKQYAEAQQTLTTLRDAWTAGLYGANSRFAKARVEQRIEMGIRGPQFPARAIEPAGVAGFMLAGNDAVIMLNDGQQLFLDSAVVFAPADAGNRFVVDDRHFNRNVWGGAASADVIRRQLDGLLASEIRQLDLRFSLTDAQRKKMQLAGRGDIHSWFDRVEELRLKATAEPLDQTRYMGVMRAAQSLNFERQNDLFGDHSLFRKTLPRALTVAQFAQLVSMERQHRLEDIGSVLGSTVPGNIDLQLSPQSREQIAALIVDRSPRVKPGRYFTSLVLLQAADLGDALRPFMDDAQWGRFQQRLALARQEEPTLRAAGLWPVRGTEEVEQ